MNCQTPPLYLPILRKENVVNLSINKILQNTSYIWPGFENMPNDYWQPENYAFTPKMAKACFDDFSAMSEAALFGMPLHSIIGSQDQKREANSMEEFDTLKHFVNTGEAQSLTPANDLHIQSAQKTLLWAWLLEERFCEINELTNNYSSSMKNLMDTLGVEQEEEFKDIEQIEVGLTNNNSLLPPWRLVLENASIFLPNSCTIVVNHKDMAEHILDLCADILQPYETNGDNSEHNTKECLTSIGHILNKNERQIKAAPWLNNKLRFILLENYNVTP